MDRDLPAAEAARPGLLRRAWNYPLVQAGVGAALVLFAVGLAALPYNAVDRSSPGLEIARALTVTGAVVLAWKAYKRWIECAPDHELALPDAPLELAAGLAAGAALFAALTGFVWGLGGIQFLGARSVGDTEFSTWAAIALMSGFIEETLFRGLLFRAVETLAGSWTALAVTSALFGLAHLFNPDATWFAGVAIAVEAGILFGAAYLLTRRLWLAIGLHAAWNFTQGWVFSVPVSGGRPPIGLFVTTRIGPQWLTGGDFGLEASAVAMVVATGAGLSLLWRASKRGQFVPAPRIGRHTKL